MWARADPASQDKLVPCPKTISAQTKVSQILCGHGALRSVKHFHSWVFSQLEFPPPISALSDRGSFSLLGFFRGWDFLHRSRRSQIGGVFHCWDFFVVGISSTDLGALRSGEYFHSWDFFTVGISSTDLGAVGIFSWLGLGALRSGEYFHSWDFSWLEWYFTVGIFHSSEVFYGWDFFTVGISSTNLGALRSGEYFHSWDFSQLGFPPAI